MTKYLDSNGLSHMWERLKSFFVAQSKIVNNATTTESGFVLDARTGKALADQITELNAQINSLNTSLANRIYPVGSIYLSVNDTDPSTFIGGTWERIKDRFMLAAGDTYASGATGGESEHTHKYGVQFGAYYGSISLERDLASGVLQKGTGGPTGAAYYNASNSIINSNAASGDKTVSTSHYRSIADTSSASNMPPYLAVYMWKRVA